MAVMCGRVRLSSDYSEIKIALKFAANAPAPNFEPDWNKPPTAPMLCFKMPEPTVDVCYKPMTWENKMRAYVFWQ
jgi:hypothetical protein